MSASIRRVAPVFALALLVPLNASALFGVGDIVHDPINYGVIGEVVTAVKAGNDLLNDVKSFSTGVRGISSIMTSFADLAGFAGLPDSFKDFAADMNDVATLAKLSASMADTVKSLNTRDANGLRGTYASALYAQRLLLVASQVGSTVTTYNSGANQQANWLRLTSAIGSAQDPLAASQMTSRTITNLGMVVTDSARAQASRDALAAQEKAVAFADSNTTTSIFQKPPSSPVSMADFQ